MEILAQGQSNDSLFFLKSGSIRVMVDGETVATFQSPGEVFGEMSVISGRKVSASIQTQTLSYFYVINPNDFNHAPAKERDRFLFLLYKIYSVVVAERLIQTNDKAKKFEIANRSLEQARTDLERINKNLESVVEERTKELRQKAQELEASYAKLEQQNAALVASFRKVSDLSDFKGRTLEKIKSLAQDHVQPLLSRLQSPKPNLELSDKTHLKEKLASLLDTIEPLLDLAAKENALQSKKVLIADPDRKQQMVARMALGGTGVDLQIASSVEETLSFLAKNEHELFICDSAFSEAMEKSYNVGFRGESVFMASGEIQSYLEQLKALPSIAHVVSRDPEDRTFTVRAILTTVTKILSSDFFGLEKYMSWGVETHEKKIQRGSLRKQAIDSMCEKLSQIGVRNTILEQVQTVSEEMLMNAIYDAPVDTQGKPLFNHLARTVDVELQEDQAATLRFACDGNILGVSVSDPFGGLTKDIIIAYLDSCYRGQAGIFNVEKGGAGRGLHQIIESSDLTIFNVKKQIRTEVLCLFQLDNTQKKNVRRPSFHYFFS